MTARSAIFPLGTPDGRLLPIQFLLNVEIGENQGEWTTMTDARIERQEEILFSRIALSDDALIGVCASMQVVVSTVKSILIFPAIWQA